MIIHRNAIKAKHDAASDADKPALKSDRQAVKILANATSYGIFVELNVEDYVTAKPMIGYGGRPQSFSFKSKKFEKPGAYFHPLLATLITGAARLMLALAEHQVIATGARLGVLRHRQHRHRKHAQPSARRVRSRPR